MRIGIVGATGFVGTRAVEMLHLTKDCDLRPIVRSYASLSRLARFELDWQLADALDRESLTAAFKGCDVVVSAVAGGYKIHEDSIKPLYGAAQDAGVARIVLVSTASVHGPNPPPGTNESSPLDDKQPLLYNNVKVRAERRLRRVRDTGSTEIVILRPGIVFGPRSRWIETLGTQLVDGTAYLIDDGRGICNSIYVDNLVQAIWLAGLAERVDGEAFLVGDAETITWADFYRPVAGAFGVDLDDIARPGIPDFPRDRVAELERDLKRSKAWGLVKTRVPRQAKDLAKGVLSGLRGASAGPAYVVPKGPQPKVTQEMALLQSATYKLPHTKAAAQLGYDPIVTFDEGIRDSIAWLDLAGYPLDPDARAAIASGTRRRLTHASEPGQN